MRCSSFTRRTIHKYVLAYPLLTVLIFFGAGLYAHATENPTLIEFDLAAGSLSEALQQFSKQASLQLLYGQNVVAGKHTAGVKGGMAPDVALKKLLEGTGLFGRFINLRTVAISYNNAPVPEDPQSAPPPVRVIDTDNGITVLTDVLVTGQQPWWAGSNSDSAFGFPKPLLETPRTVSSINGDAISLFSLSAVEDLLRIVPGVFTTTRFGVQGSVDIRNIPADTYFRGMKRLTLQGHGRSVLAATDTIEVVGGPASPLLGIGKIGGYVNFVPKSGRSRTGQYLNETNGFTQVIAGEYERRELSFGFGGPVELDAVDKQGGYYVYGLVEDSDSYTLGVPVKQLLFQAATSIDNMIGPFRLETGVNYQESRTAGALTGRFTQDLVDHGTYIGGSPLANLDLNGNGTIGYLEMQSASPVVGKLSNNNQPLQQVFDWPTDSTGRPLTIDQFPKTPGIPQSMYDYLQAHPEADPTGLLRAQGVGGPLPISGAVPVGMVLDPRTVTINPYNPRRSAAFEKDLKAEFLTLFADFVYDEDPDFTIKNQLFFDSMNQYKSSNQPFSQVQDVYVIEDKLTLTRRVEALPSWLQINQAFSVNARNTVSKGKVTFGDYGNHRTDATASNWNSNSAGMTANTTFTSANEEVDLYRDGLPWQRLYRTEFSEIGAGVLFDIDFFTDTNLLLGARIDGSDARNTDYAGGYLFNTGTSSNPGAYTTTDVTAEGWDSAVSWSVSLSQQLPYGLRPYVTLADSGVLLDNNNNSLHNDVIEAGHISSALLKEAGIKASWLDGSLSFSTSIYEQSRTDASAEDVANVVNAYATSTTTEGWQTEIKWAPMGNLFISMYALKQITRYAPNVGGLIQLDASALGFSDVLDADGNVIYPAEAFLYGGRARIVLPDGMKQYERKQGNPENQFGMSTIYQFDDHWGMTLKGNYLSSTCSGRLCLVRLPQSLVFDTGVFWSDSTLDVKLDVTNINDEQYFRARTGDTLGDVIAQPMPGRTTQLTVNFKF